MKAGRPPFKLTSLFLLSLGLALMSLRAWPQGKELQIISDLSPAICSHSFTPRISVGVRKISLLVLLGPIRAIKAVNAYLTRTLTAPAWTNLDIAPDTLTEAWIGDYSLGVRLGKLKSAATVSAVALHEYGHLIFDWNLRLYSRVWKTYADRLLERNHFQREKIQPVYKQRQSVQSTLEMLRRRHPGSATLEQMETKYQDLLDQQYALMDEMDRLYPMPEEPVEVEFKTQYSELFADLIPILQQNDPKAMSTALAELGETQALGRDFTQKIPALGWSTDDVHHVLDPVRSYLWEKHLNRPLSNDQKARLIEQVYDVLAKDLIEKTASPALREETVESLNLRLIGKLEIALAR